MEKRTKRIMVVVLGLILVALTVFVSLGILMPLLSSLEDPEGFRRWADEKGVFSRLVVIGLLALKVIIPLIPGRPLEIGAGYTFGVFEGTILCLTGAVVGSLVVFLLVRKVGIKVLDLFYPREKLLSLNFLKDEKRLEVWVFFIMFVPGTPKDFFSYFVGLTNIKLSTWLLISATARIPNILISTVGGNSLGNQDYLFAIIVFLITVVISAVGLSVYTFAIRKKEKTR